MNSGGNGAPGQQSHIYCQGCSAGAMRDGHMAHHRVWKQEQRMENRLTMLGWCFLPSTAPFLPALTKRLGNEVGGRVRSHLAPAGLLQSRCSSPPFAVRAVAYDSGLGSVKVRASTLALWSPGHIHPLTFSEDNQSSVMSSQEKQ